MVSNKCLKRLSCVKKAENSLQSVIKQFYDCSYQFTRLRKTTFYNFKFLHKTLRTIIFSHLIYTVGKCAKCMPQKLIITAIFRIVLNWLMILETLKIKVC